MSAEVALPPRFKLGDRVRVRKAYPPGHLRTPFYIRGRKGTIAHTLGPFPNPEELAYARPGTPLQPLYRVRFRQSEVWPDYCGPRQDTLDVEIFQHWLEPA
jgi:Nitrile hydratase beta subunit, C-terminal